MKSLCILGSTGSIGRSTLQVVDDFPGRFRVVALGGGRNVELLERQARKYRPERVATADEETAEMLRGRLGAEVEVFHGREGMENLARRPASDLVVCGIVGAVGMFPTYAALDAGIPVALANKEALVLGGRFMTERAAETGAMILPVDSEHNALHQCMRGEDAAEVRHLWLTASGGPFRATPKEELERVRVEQALRHPTWNMGPKITIDSATLMNKGLEVIEAFWLFGLGAGKIRVVVHPGSAVHSMVEFVDGSFKAQLGVTDMQHPIQYALTWPERLPAALDPFDPVAAGPLEFEHPDLERFPCLRLAYEALEAGGAAAAVLNAANEVAVHAFLEGRVGFMDIPRTIEGVLAERASDPADNLDDLIAADGAAREAARRMLAEGVRS